MRVVALCPDLLFRTRLRETASAAGAELGVARNAGEIRAELDKEAELLVVDLSAGGEAALAAMRDARAEHPELRIVGFYSHVQRDIPERARAAGCDEVMARSAFVDALPGLLGASPTRR
jgi:DNA-binding NarL/FixJ family response regulator